MSNFLNKISKVSIYLLVFLLPLFFLPWTSNVLDFNKQVLLIFLVFISLFGWLLKSLKEGKINLNWSSFNLPVIGFLAILGIGTIFSTWQYGSFWGLPLNIASSFFTILVLVLLYFLVVNNFIPLDSKTSTGARKNELFWLMFTFASSGFLAVLFGGFQLFGKFFLPFDFTKIVSFNTIGTVNSLGVFAALLLPLIISLIFISKRFVKFLLIIFGAAALGIIFLVNFWVAWILLLIGIAVILIFGIARRELFKSSWLTLSMVLLVISLFFGVFRISIPFLPATPLEVSPSQTATFNIAAQTLKESTSNLLLGSGPSTFIYDYAKFKPETINQTAFWGVRFASGGSEILDKLATTGILGLISFLSILALFFWLAVKTLISPRNGEIKSRQPGQDQFWVLGLGIFASWLAATVGFFLYPGNLSLGFLFWVLTAAFIVFSNSRVKTWELKPGSLANIGVSFIFIFIFILGLGVFFMTGQRYIAEIRYLQGIEYLREGDNSAATNYVLSAISHTNGSQDNYWRDLSQIYLFDIRKELEKEGVSEEDISLAVAPLVSNAVNSAKQATDVAPENVANWTVRGFVYRNLINLIGGADEWAIKSYQKAIELEPTNPYIRTELGRIYFDQEKQDQAKEQFEKAISLKEDYSNARYFLGFIYDEQGEKDLAIFQFERIAELNPDNEEVKEILANLRAGKAALKGIGEITPIEEKPEEQLEE